MLASSVFAGPAWCSEKAIELTVAGFYRKYTDDHADELVGLGLRGRYVSLSSNGWGWFVRFHFDEHVVNPVIIPAAARRWGDKSFFELGLGAYVGTLVGRSIVPAVTATFGFDLGRNFYVSVPLYWDMNMGSPVLAEFTPFIGYRF